jgi:hypothetical protein
MEPPLVVVVPPSCFTLHGLSWMTYSDHLPSSCAGLGGTPQPGAAHQTGRSACWLLERHRDAPAPPLYPSSRWATPWVYLSSSQQSGLPLTFPSCTGAHPRSSLSASPPSLTGTARSTSELRLSRCHLSSPHTGPCDLAGQPIYWPGNPTVCSFSRGGYCLLATGHTTIVTAACITCWEHALTVH